MKQSLLEKLIEQVVQETIDEAMPPPVPQAARGQTPQPQQGLPRPVPTPPPQAFGLQQTSGPVTEPIAQTLIKMFGQKLRDKKGIDAGNLQKLGVGTQGVAYGAGDKVLKITGDVREAKTAAILMKQPLPNVIQFYDAWQFPSTEFYGIMMEKLQPLTKDDSDKLNGAIINTKFPVFLYKANGDWNKGMQDMARSLMQTYAQQAFKQFNTTDIKDQKVQEFIKPKIDQAIKDFDTMTKQYKLRDLFKSLKQLGIEYYDFHAGNYGKRADGSLVLFDLGNGKVKGGEMPPMLLELAKKIKLNVL
jgi:hypothetical protein